MLTVHGQGRIAPFLFRPVSESEIAFNTDIGTPVFAEANSAALSQMAETSWAECARVGKKKTNRNNNRAINRLEIAATGGALEITVNFTGLRVRGVPNIFNAILAANSV